MPDPVRHDRSGRPPSTPKDFLRLADSDADHAGTDSNGSSTHQLDADAATKPTTPGQPGSRAEPPSERTSAASFFAGTEGGAAESGKSGSSFDTMLGKLVVERGLISAEEMELCRGLMHESRVTDSPRTLSDLLVDNEFLTQRQLSRLRTDFEADRSSQKIPGYRILKKLGSGAMATVFLAKQLSLDRLVAIKVLPKKFSANSKFIERFYKEGRAAAKLNDPNVVAAYDVGQAGEHHYFVMEYVDGDTVYDRIVAKKRVSEHEAIDVIRQVASALKHAHQRGFIHRDIKPKNVMLSKAGVVKLADLGLARALSDKEAAEAESGRAYGTPYYISPEQIRGQVDIGPQADIYGLGATFYHMVTGRVPFDGKNPSDVMHRHLKAELTPPDHINPKVSAGCASVIEMMLAKDARDRYQSAEDLIHDLDLVRKGQAPHFAKAHVDFTSVAKELNTAPATATADIPRLHNPRGERTLVMVMAGALIVSVLANMGLLVALLAK